MQRYIPANNVSTIICNGSSHRRGVAYDNELIVDMQRENLADYVRRMRVQEKKFSLTDVERNSGGEIDASYVNRIENGLVTNVTPDKLRALAKGLQVFEDEIFAVARGKSITDDPTYDEQRLLSFFRMLPTEWQDELLAHAELTSKRHGQPSAIPTPATTPHHRARRKPVHAADYTPDRLKKKDNDEGKNRQAK
jgi:transcriptional regulator with XRE-family HTH domain